MPTVLETSARLLRLLSLLQTRPFWTGPQLAERLEVTPRTLRRDIGRLRELGYPVEAAPGRWGGYQLGPGAALPPLLLDDDEAVAVAVGLRTAAGGTIAGLDEAATAALTKLERVLPRRLQHRVEAIGATTMRLSPALPQVDASLLVVLATACQSQERVRFSYCDRADRRTERLVEPYRLVHTGRRWYLAARDVRRSAWRTFRLDRISDPEPSGHHFTFDDPPDAVALVAEGISAAPYRYRARVLVRAPAHQVAEVVPAAVAMLEPADGDTTILTSGADDLGFLAAHLAGLPFEFEVLEPADLRARMRELGRRLLQAHDD